MKVTQRAKRRYQRIRQARRQFRYTFKTFRHTRATRRSLAAMVQRMVVQSRRYALHAQAIRRDEYKIVIHGWPDAVHVTVGVYGLSFLIIKSPAVWDYLLWPDCMPLRKHGLWRCFAPRYLKSSVYQRLEDLLFNYLAEPFLAYLAEVPEQAQLMIYDIEGKHYACVEEINPVMCLDQTDQPIVCWPLP